MSIRITSGRFAREFERHAAAFGDLRAETARLEALEHHLPLGVGLLHHDHGAAGAHSEALAVHRHDAKTRLQEACQADDDADCTVY